MNDVLARLAALQAQDLPVQGGRTLAYVYDSGLESIDQIGRAAVAAYAGSNGLDPTSFPSLLQMENELVGMTCDLLDAPSTAVGTVTSGGTESVLLAVQAARDAQPVSSPNMVLPSTAHAAFHKAAHYFGVAPRVVPVGRDFRADPAAMATAIDSSTVLVVASAPSYAHGVIDPVSDIASLAASRGVRCHVDACIGGWVLPFAARVGREVRPWNFSVPGVTSISVDTHKYAYAPKGTSVLVHRDSSLRRPQYFASAAWPGYTMLNSTMQSTKSGGPLAGAWAVTQSLGVEGYLSLTRSVFGSVDAIVAGLDAMDGVSVMVPPDSTLIAVMTDGTCDPFTISDEMTTRGWYVQPQLSCAGDPATIHLSVSAATSAPDFLAAFGSAVEEAVASGPIHVDPEVAAFIEALDPSVLSDADFDGLLAVSGLLVADGADLTLPERLAPINAMLDLASPALREALLLAFLDRLSRPTRAS